MTQKSNISKTRIYRKDPGTRIGDSDGITEKSVNLTLIALSIIVLGLAIASTAMAQSVMDPDIRTLTEAAMMDMNDDLFDRALEKLVIVQANAPTACVHHLMGVCYFKLGNTVAAQIHLDHAIEDLLDEEEGGWDPSLEKAPIHALNYLGKMHYERGDFDTAIKYFSKFLVNLYLLEDSDQWLIDWTEELIAECESYQVIASNRSIGNA